MILSIRKFFKAISLILTLLIMTVGFSSCRSSKHVSKDQTYRIENIRHSHISQTQKDIVEEAITWMGTPYSYAGSEKGKGTDCSGMVMRIYEDVTGSKLPRNSAKQAEFCKKLKKRDVKAGDLVFFATGKDEKTVSHVGIMLDDVNFIHASSKGGVVISSIETPYYIRTFIMFGRVPM